ncbi:MAG: hypothetical protein U0W24_24930 [Bacteroidales bacterium]
MKKLLLLQVLALFYMGCTDKNSQIEWISTTDSLPWQLKPTSAFSIAQNQDPSIIIDTNETQQKIDGFGGCFNELGWEALGILETNLRDSVIKSLFDTILGCKFNICRMPIGANDYALDWYSYDETPGDFEMKNFSIERDKKNLIPYIKEALNYNPSLKIWASPWCPPSWMKTNGHYACNPDVVNDLPKNKAGKEMVDQFIIDDKYLKAYALYFSKFNTAFKNEGIPVYAVHVQNEPNSCQNFPSCIWTPSSLAKFIGKFLGPQMQKDHPETEIWLGTIERPQIERVDTILQDSLAQKYIKGVAFQWAGKNCIPEVHKKYPGFRLMQSETECGNGSNDWGAAVHTFELMKHYFENGANSYMYWNMVLNESGKSQWGWKQNSMISINTSNKSVRYNPEFYLMKHFSYFIEPGAVKISIKGENKNCLAFKNKHSIVIIYYNAGDAREVMLKVNGSTMKLECDKESFNTWRVSI